MIARKAAKKSGRRQEVKAGQVNTLPPKLKVKVSKTARAEDYLYAIREKDSTYVMFASKLKS